MATKKAKTDKTADKVKRVRVTGFAPLKFKEFTITQKSSGRYAIANSAGVYINGAEKVKLLLEAKILKESLKKPTEAAPAT